MFKWYDILLISFICIIFYYYAKSLSIENNEYQINKNKKLTLQHNIDECKNNLLTCENFRNKNIDILNAYYLESGDLNKCNNSLSDLQNQIDMINDHEIYLQNELLKKEDQLQNNLTLDYNNYIKDKENEYNNYKNDTDIYINENKSKISELNKKISDDEKVLNDIETIADSCESIPFVPKKYQKTEFYLNIVPNKVIDKLQQIGVVPIYTNIVNKTCAHFILIEKYNKDIKFSSIIKPIIIMKNNFDQNFYYTNPNNINIKYKENVSNDVNNIIITPTNDVQLIILYYKFN